MRACLTVTTTGRPNVHIAARWAGCGYGVGPGATRDTHALAPTSSRRLLCQLCRGADRGLGAARVLARPEVARRPRKSLPTVRARVT